MNNWKKLIPIAAMLAIACIAPAAEAQSTLAKTSSAAGSPPSATRAGGRQQIVNACAATVDELTAARELVRSLDVEVAALRQRLETEKALAEGLTELNSTRKSEADALRTAITAKNDTIAAKDAVIAAQDKLIVQL